VQPRHERFFLQPKIDAFDEMVFFWSPLICEFPARTAIGTFDPPKEKFDICLRRSVRRDLG
jgi:hypothetical protein